PRSPPANIERFIAPDVDQRRLEARKQLPEQVLDKRPRARLGWTKRERPPPFPLMEVPRIVALDLAEVLILRPAQPPREMAEAVLVCGELDAPGRGVRVELTDLGGRQRRRGRVLPDILVTGVRECVLGVKLEMVALERGEEVHGLAQLGHRGNF